MHLSIVIPVLNEGENLKDLLPALHDTAALIVADHEIVLVDGGSVDNTWQVGENGGAVVLRQRGRGYGAALRDGFAAARGEYILTLDGDMSHNPDFIPGMWNKRNGADCVIASRYIAGGSAEMTMVRWFLSRALNKFFTIGLSLPFCDISSGFRLYRASILGKLDLVSSEFDILEEILIKAYGNGYKIVEMPFHYGRRKSGESHVNLFMFGISYLRTFGRMWRLRRSLSSSGSERQF